MRKKLSLLPILMVAVMALMAIPFTASADGEDFKNFDTGLSFSQAGIEIDTNDAFSGAYAFDMGFRALGTNQEAHAFTILIGLASGDYYVHLNVFGRGNGAEGGFKAYAFTQAGDSAGTLSVTNKSQFTGENAGREQDFPIVSGWWPQSGVNFVYGLRVSEDGNSIDLAYGKTYNDPQYGVHNTINLGAFGGAAAGKIKIIPSVQTSFDIDYLKSDEQNIDLSEAVTLTNPENTQKYFTAGNASYTADVSKRLLTPIKINSSLFENDDDVLFDLKFSYQKLGSAPWQTASNIGIMLGMQSLDAKATDSDVTTVGNNTGTVKFTATRGDGTAANNITAFGTDTAHSENDVVNGLVTLSLTGKNNGDLDYSYIEGSKVAQTGTIADCNFDGYIALYYDFTFSTTYPITVNINDVLVNINERLSVDGVTLDADTASIKEGVTHQLSAAVLPSNAYNKTVSYLSSDTSVATVDGTGLVTAVAAGTATITVTTVDGGLSDTCEVTVYKAVTGVSLSQASATLNKGKTIKLTATVLPADAGISGVIFTTSDAETALVGSDGTVTGVAKGSAVITVTTEDGGFTDTCTITINVGVTSVVLSENTKTLMPNGTFTLNVEVFPGNADNSACTFASDNAAVAEVAEDGVVTAKASGTATITVTSVDGDFTDTCIVTVTTPVTGVILNKTTAEINKGSALKLTATVSPDTAVDKSVTFISSDAKIATVDNDGNVTAVAAGTATITVTTTDGEFSATCEITVLDDTTSGGCNAGLTGNGSVFAIFVIAVFAIGCILFLKKKSSNN